MMGFLGRRRSLDARHGGLGAQVGTVCIGTTNSLEIALMLLQGLTHINFSRPSAQGSPETVCRQTELPVTVTEDGCYWLAPGAGKEAVDMAPWRRTSSGGDVYLALHHAHMLHTSPCFFARLEVVVRIPGR